MEKKEDYVTYQSSKFLIWFCFAIWSIFAMCAACTHVWIASLIFMVIAIYHLAHLGQKITINDDGFVFEGRNTFLIPRNYQLRWKEITSIEKTIIKSYRIGPFELLHFYGADGQKLCSIRVDWFKASDIENFETLLKKKKQFKVYNNTNKILLIVFVFCILLILLLKFVI